MTAGVCCRLGISFSTFFQWGRERHLPPSPIPKKEYVVRGFSLVPSSPLM
jgi:hypothetical protein